MTLTYTFACRKGNDLYVLLEDDDADDDVIVVVLSLLQMLLSDGSDGVV